jgi:hypothetical protein
MIFVRICAKYESVNMQQTINWDGNMIYIAFFPILTREKILFSLTNHEGYFTIQKKVIRFRG